MCLMRIFHIVEEIAWSRMELQWWNKFRDDVDGRAGSKLPKRIPDFEFQNCGKLRGGANHNDNRL